VTVFRKNNRLSQFAGRAHWKQTQCALHFVHKRGNLTHLCFDLLFTKSHHQFCHPGVGYFRCFPHSARNSHLFSFPPPTFELVSFPTLIPWYFSISTQSLRDCNSKKIWPHFIFSNSMKKRPFYLLLISASGTQKKVRDVRLSQSLSDSHTRDIEMNHKSRSLHHCRCPLRLLCTAIYPLIWVRT
jgi:hypothetical protein